MKAKQLTAFIMKVKRLHYKEEVGGSAVKVIKCLHTQLVISFVNILLFRLIFTKLSEKLDDNLPVRWKSKHIKETIVSNQSKIVIFSNIAFGMLLFSLLKVCIVLVAC